MIEQARELIAKAERFAAMDDATLAKQSVRTLLTDLAQALRESTAANAETRRRLWSGRDGATL